MKKQRTNKELEAIIDEFASALRTAYKPFVANYRPSCEHFNQIAFTGHMQNVWYKYVEFCRKVSNG